MSAPPPSPPPSSVIPKSSPQPAERYLGLTIDNRYVVEKLLSRGGMGAVYLCRRTVIDKLVAMKVLRAELMHDPETTERFIIEAKAASAIGSPHIVEVFDFGTMPDGCTYFVMEYLVGDSLGTVLQRERRLPPERAIRIAKQIAEALAAAHDVQIVHRDLKPDNVVLVERDQTEFVKILDFGLAKVARRQGRLTRVGKVFGTPHYMSPEQSRGKPVDQRTDVYALGIILYEMLSGHVPFEGDSPVTILAGHVHGEVQPLRVPGSREKNVSAELEAVVLKCLAKRPEHRYPSMRALFADLERVERGEVPDALREQAMGDQNLGNVEALLASLEEWEEEDEEARVLVDADDSEISLAGIERQDVTDIDARPDTREPFADAEDEREATEVDASPPGEAPAEPTDTPEAPKPEPATSSSKPARSARTSAPPLWPLGVGVLVLLGLVVVLFWRVRHAPGPAPAPAALASAPGQTPSELPATVPSQPVLSAAPAVEASGEPEALAPSAVPSAKATASSRWVMVAVEPDDAELYSGGIQLGTPPLPLEVKDGEPIALEARRHGYWTNRFKIDGTKSRVLVHMAPILKRRRSAPEGTEAEPLDGG